MTTRANARITAALVIKDKVIVGAGNCGPGSANKEGGKVAGYSPPGGCFITGHDLETGKDAFDDRDGKVLWESPRLNDIPNAFRSPTWWTANSTSPCRPGTPGSRATARCTPRRSTGPCEVRNRRSCGCGSCPEKFGPPRSQRGLVCEGFRVCLRTSRRPQIPRHAGAGSPLRSSGFPVELVGVGNPSCAFLCGKAHTWALRVLCGRNPGTLRS
jgi:hypothetical protein